MGEVKQWYGVPAESFSSFEKISRDFYRETYQDSPDMLHHMTTQIAVSRLIANSVPVFQAKQQARSFIVTFPKAYHCGFSYGFNVGEAVNFALPDWLPFGFEADSKYRNVPRTSVFSHVRLLFTLLHYCNELNGPGKRELFRQLEVVLLDEIEGRRSMHSLGIIDPSAATNTRTAFTNNFTTIDESAVDNDDNRLCIACKQVCVFSAVACECNHLNISCWRHVSFLCKCRKPEKKDSSVSLSQRRQKNRQFLISWATVDDLKMWLKQAQEKLLGNSSLAKPSLQLS